MPDFDLPMTDGEQTTEEESELGAPPAPESLASELGLELSEEERADAEQMVARLRSQFGLEDVEEDTPDEAESEEEEAEEAPEVEQPAEEPATASADWITIDGRSVPVAEARSMLELRQYLAQNPDKADAVRRAIEGEAKEEPPAPVQPPEWMDLEDPAQRFLWEKTQQQDAALAQIYANQKREAEARARNEALVQVDSAMQTFRTSHPELTEDEVQTVRKHAVALNIIPGLEKVEPTGGAAVLKALDIAYKDHPDFWARQQGLPTVKEQKAAEAKSRKQKLHGVSGSGTTATRTPEAPKKPESDREMRTQAAAWLHEQGII